MDAQTEATRQHGASDARGEILLEVQDLRMYFPIRQGLLRRTTGYVKAVDGVSFAVRRGETLGLVGESGCGKTTTGRAILRAYAPTGGQIFQDPYSSLNPRMTVLQIIGDPLRVNGVATGKAMEDRVAALLRRVGLRPEYMRRYPHAFSGGERQRISIARALALDPQLVVADEAVSALDVSVRAQILNLLQDLQQELGLTYLFVAHDLSVVEYICDRVAVMYVGKLVEVAETEELYIHPLHPYTEALLSAVPLPDPRLRDKERRIRLEGEVADPANRPSGCPFHPRCRYAQENCKTDEPPLREVRPGHFAACHYAETLTLRGVVGEGVVA
jgi:peptide/nickel transport system ATP-binding protein